MDDPSASGYVTSHSDVNRRAFMGAAIASALTVQQSVLNAQQQHGTKTKKPPTAVYLGLKPPFDVKVIDSKITKTEDGMEALETVHGFGLGNSAKSVGTIFYKRADYGSAYSIALNISADLYFSGSAKSAGYQRVTLLHFGQKGKVVGDVRSDDVDTAIIADGKLFKRDRQTVVVRLAEPFSGFESMPREEAYKVILGIKHPGQLATSDSVTGGL